MSDTFIALKEDLGEVGFDFKALTCDVTDVEFVRAVVSQNVERFGSIHFAWNNAGYQGDFAYTLDYDPADFSRVMEINVTGQFIVLQAVAKQMVQQAGSGWSIVNTASVAGMHCTPAMIAYSASKSASISMTITAAKDLAQYGIRVNAVSPALIGAGYMWDRQNQLHAQVGGPYYAQDSDQVAKDNSTVFLSSGWGPLKKCCIASHFYSAVNRATLPDLTWSVMVAFRQECAEVA